MYIDDLQAYCLAKKGVTAHFPFDEVTLVFKVMNKMFCLTNLTSWEEDQPRLNLKCDPEKAIVLREQYEAVAPGYHMSKIHWNTVRLGLDAPEDQIYAWVDDSYDLIVAKLTKKDKEQLSSL